MALTDDFLSKDEEQEIVDAIVLAELKTSGEIRVHIDASSKTSLLKRAHEVFLLLEMDKTAAKNGVLFYISIQNKSFAIVGDKGIDSKVEDTFWDSTKNMVINHFKLGNYKTGLVEGILKAGEKLKVHFPYQEEDINELSNEISKGY